MIALLSCSTNLSINSNAAISSTGGLEQDSLTHDSILISYNDLRKANSKLIELEYEKTINRHLKAIVANDSIAISGLRNRIFDMDRDCNNTVKRYKRQRNIAEGIGIGTIILLIISIL